jgi:hypothetical protein
VRRTLDVCLGVSAGALTWLEVFDEASREAAHDAAARKLEALDTWLSDREQSSICVAIVGRERRCTLCVAGVTFEGWSEVQGPRPEDGWCAQWRAIRAAISLAETFERAGGADVG